ncbi:MAG: hypothetical protein AVDCRST_MAG16-2362, partial [uncultured Frankineae bacterium]
DDLDPARHRRHHCHLRRARAAHRRRPLRPLRRAGLRAGDAARRHRPAVLRPPRQRPPSVPARRRRVDPRRDRQAARRPGVQRRL